MRPAPARVSNGAMRFGGDAKGPSAALSMRPGPRLVVSSAERLPVRAWSSVALSVCRFPLGRQQRQACAGPRVAAGKSHGPVGVRATRAARRCGGCSGFLRSTRDRLARRNPRVDCERVTRVAIRRQDDRRFLTCVQARVSQRLSFFIPRREGVVLRTDFAERAVAQHLRRTGLTELPCGLFSARI